MLKASEPVQFEPQFVAALREVFEQRIAFNQVLGLKITDVAPQLVQGRIAMRPELIGHAAYERIHGGVISAALDSMGGLAVMAAICAKHMDDAPLQRLHRFSRLGTIDLRVDYLRPGIGLAVNDGPRRAYRKGKRVDLGSPITFEPELAAGWRINDRFAIEASWVHLSHATIFSRQNRGMDSMGVRLLYRLP